jgi:hypothetical protein
MRTSGIASDRPMTIAVILVSIGFLIVLAGGPSQFLFIIEHTLERLLVMAAQFAQGLHS